METMTLTSDAFEHNGAIPSKYTCDGANTSTPLSWSGVPEEAQSLVLIMDDPDIPESVKESLGIDVFDHWVAFNIDPKTTGVKEGEEPDGTLGNNSAGSVGYRGPCPPDAEHRYIFRIHALDTTLDLSEGANKAKVEEAMEGHVIAQGELIGRYNRVES